VTDRKSYETLLKEVARRIKKARLARGLTQEDMVRHGFNYRHYQRFESGEHSFGLYSLFRIAKALGIKLRDLF
jgi:transcriptional regulator with XRE-family HTH domain